MSYLNTRDLYKRQCELQEELDALQEELEEAKEAYENSEENYEQLAEEEGADDPEAWLRMERSYLTDKEVSLAEWKEEHQEELDALDQLENEIGREWIHGETLIPEDKFKDYAMDLADDLHGSAVRNASWPFDCIDWEQAAEELKMDYSTVEYQGDTYYFRE